jgi:hypothetical protein
MESNEHDALSADERRAFDALPRERVPGRLLEERTVAALRARGILRPLPGRRVRWHPRFVIAAIAASLALFAGGVGAGHWLATRSPEPLAQPATADASESVLNVQRAGTAYVSALTQLVAAADSADAPAAAQAREVALAALWAAAGEVVRLAPDDPVASQILRGFERARQEQVPVGSQQPPVRQVIWF